MTVPADALTTSLSATLNVSRAVRREDEERSMQTATLWDRFARMEKKGTDSVVATVIRQDIESDKLAGNCDVQQNGDNRAQAHLNGDSHDGDSHAPLPDNSTVAPLMLLDRELERYDEQVQDQCAIDHDGNNSGESRHATPAAVGTAASTNAKGCAGGTTDEGSDEQRLTKLVACMLECHRLLS